MRGCFRYLILAPILALLLAGCATLAGVTEKPRVSLKSLAPLEIGLLEQRFLLQLRVENPNRVEIPIEGLSFTVELNGQPFAEGLSDKAVTLPALGEGLVEVKASTRLSRLLKRFQEMAEQGRSRLDYRIVGKLHSPTLGTVPFDSRGQISPEDLWRENPGKAPRPKPLPGSI